MDILFVAVSAIAGIVIAKVTLTVSFAKEAKIVLIAKVVIFASTVFTVSAVCIALIVSAANF